LDLLNSSEVADIKKINLLHVITSLNGGGAEAMLFKLVKEIDKDKFNISIISLLDEGVYGDELKLKYGVDLLCVNLDKPINFIKNFKQILKFFKRSDMIHSWMYHANIFSFLFSKISKRKLIWGIHHNDFSKNNNKLTTRLIMGISKIMSSKIDKIIYCGYEVKKNHIKFGYNNRNAIVIFNGFETEKFSPLKSTHIHNELNIDLKTKLFVHVGRWNVIKGYAVLLEAISLLDLKNQNVKFILVGKDITNSNFELTDLIEKYGVSTEVILLGRREDVPGIMASSDYFISSSLSEGFPNVIGEAMLSEALCIVTDTGDSKMMLGDLGFISKVGDAADLAKNIEAALKIKEDKYVDMTKKARSIVIENYSLEKITKLHMELYINLHNQVY